MAPGRYQRRDAAGAVRCSLVAVGVYEYRLAYGTSRWRAVYRTSNALLAQKRGFRGPRDAQRWRTAMLAAVHRGEVVATRERFSERFDSWLRDGRGTRTAPTATIASEARSA